MLAAPDSILRGMATVEILLVDTDDTGSGAVTADFDVADVQEFQIQQLGPLGHTMAGQAVLVQGDPGSCDVQVDNGVATSRVLVRFVLAA